MSMVKRYLVLVSKDIRNVQDGRSLCFLPSWKRLGRIRDVLTAISGCFCDAVMLSEIFGTVFARGGCSTHAPFIQRPLISFAHLSPSLVILATRFNRGPCIHVAGVCLRICFWSCHVWGATPCCMLQVRRGETKEGKGRTTQENHKTKH